MHLEVSHDVVESDALMLAPASLLVDARHAEDADGEKTRHQRLHGQSARVARIFTAIDFLLKTSIVDHETKSSIEAASIDCRLAPRVCLEDVLDGRMEPDFLSAWPRAQIDSLPSRLVVRQLVEFAARKHH